MEPRYLYTDARGVRTGPFSESELERLAEIGGIDWGGSIELEGLGRSWRITEVGWLADAMTRARNRRREVIDGTALPVDEPAATAAEVPAAPGPDDEPPPASAPAPAPAPPPPPTPPTTPPVGAQSAPPPSEAACARSTYILLALLPAFVGIFGIHNIVAGHPRGIVQLVLSLATFGGVIGLAIAAPCCCVGVPVWLALFAWTLIDVLTVTTDARGATMR
jgi:hypothetical protein